MVDSTLLPLAILLLTISTWFTIHHAKKQTSCFVILLSIIAFGLGFATVALLPIDLSYASSTHAALNSTAAVDDGSDSNEGADSSTTASSSTTDLSKNNPTYLPYQITYWTTFLLAWLILPITRETLLSGQFTFRQRLKAGIYNSIRSIFLMMIMGTLFTIGMMIHLKSVHLITIVLPVLMALSNTYGLLLVFLLLGNGLINIPKKLWRIACPSTELRRTRIISCNVEEELFESVMELEDVECKIDVVCENVVGLDNGEFDNDEDGIQQLSTRRGTRLGMLCCKTDEVTEFHECLEELVRRKNETIDLCSERRTRRPGSRGSNNRRISNNDNDDEDNGDTNNGGEINTMDIKYLVILSSQLQRAQERVTSAQLRWDHLVEHGRLFSALLIDNDNSNGSSSIQQIGSNDEMNDNGDSISDTTLLDTSTTYSKLPKWCHTIHYSSQRLWIRYLRYPTYKCLSIITAILSVFILLSEVTISIPINLCPFSWILHTIDKLELNTQLLFQFFALIPLLYMSICVYTCLFQMSLLGPYCLRGNRQSNGVALVFNAQYLVRLQFSLGYNYLLM